VNIAKLPELLGRKDQTARAFRFLRRPSDPMRRGRWQRAGERRGDPPIEFYAVHGPGISADEIVEA
jgi:hypothetical protein